MRAVVSNAVHGEQYQSIKRERERWRGGGGITCGCAFVGSTRDSMASTSAAVLSVPLCDCTMKFCGG